MLFTQVNDSTKQDAKSDKEHIITAILKNVINTAIKSTAM